MKIFAYRFTCKQKGELVHGMEMRAGIDGIEIERKLIQEIENDGTGVEKGTIKILGRDYMSLQRLVRDLKPEFETLVKTAKMKSELLDAISKLPIN